MESICAIDEVCKFVRFWLARVSKQAAHKRARESVLCVDVIRVFCVLKSLHVILIVGCFV